MTYILNAIAVGASVPEHCASGQFITEVDEPAFATLTVGDKAFPGIRYLIVRNDGSGYTSSMAFVYVPSSADDPAILRVGEDVEAFEHLLTCLLALSPVRRLILYLEANRIISRFDPTEAHQPSVVLNRAMTLPELLAIVEERRFVEEAVYILGDMVQA